MTNKQKRGRVTALAPTPFSKEQLDALRRAHRPSKDETIGGDEVCNECYRLWPCNTSRLLVNIESNSDSGDAPDRADVFVPRRMGHPPEPQPSDSGDIREAARVMAEYLEHRVGCPAKGPGANREECTCGLEAILSMPLRDHSDSGDIDVERLVAAMHRAVTHSDALCVSVCRCLPPSDYEIKQATTIAREYARASTPETPDE